MATDSRTGIPGQGLAATAPGQRRSSDVRIGPITIFALLVVLCMAVLAVLSISTAHASYVMADRQATATSELYLDETAAQAFLAEMDGRLVEVRDGRAGQAARQVVETSLSDLCAAAQDAAGGQVEAHANMAGAALNADFTCANGRILYVTITVQDDGTYRIDKWKMTAVATEEEPAGTLWAG